MYLYVIGDSRDDYFLSLGRGRRRGGDGLDNILKKRNGQGNGVNFDVTTAVQHPVLCQEYNTDHRPIVVYSS